MEFLVVSALNGLIYGLLLFMVAAGLTLVFGMMGIVNFAHASFYMIGAYLAFTISGIAGFWVGLLVAPLIVAAIGMGVERFALRRVYDHGPSYRVPPLYPLTRAREGCAARPAGEPPVSASAPSTGISPRARGHLRGTTKAKNARSRAGVGLIAGRSADQRCWVGAALVRASQWIKTLNAVV
jgi:hypothetical protein